MGAILMALVFAALAYTFYALAVAIWMGSIGYGWAHRRQRADRRRRAAWWWIAILGLAAVSAFVQLHGPRATPVEGWRGAPKE